MAGIFGEFFLALRLPRNEAREVLEKFGENSEQNSGQDLGRKFEKFGKLSFCHFPDLTICHIVPVSRAYVYRLGFFWKGWVEVPILFLWAHSGGVS